MLWFWIILGCLAVLLFAVLEFRAERKPVKFRPGKDDYRESGTDALGGHYGE